MLGLRLPATMKLFGRSTKTPSEVTKSLKDALLLMEVDREKDRRRGVEEAGKHLATMKVMMQGNEAHEPIPEVNTQIMSEMIKANVVEHLIVKLSTLEFESRKEAVLIIGSMLRRQIGVRWPMAEYMADHAELLDLLVNSYKYNDLCSAVGTILRDCIRHERLAGILLDSRSFELFFGLVENKHFDIASDSFSTFKELLTRHKPIVAHFISQKYDFFFDRLNRLLKSENYVAKRQSIRLLGELLINRLNFSAMIRYASSSENLKQIMNLLSDRSRSIQFETFHVFKVFVANPEKNKATLDILTRNRVKLLGFLEDFCNERDKDDQFNDEKHYVMKQIHGLSSSPTVASANRIEYESGGQLSTPTRHSPRIMEQPRA